MVKLYNSSSEFEKDFNKYVPSFIRKNVPPVTLGKTLHIIAVIFVVLPRKSVESMALYLYNCVADGPLQTHGRIYTACLVTSQLFVWTYPVVIFSLVVAFIPLSIIIGTYNYLHIREDLLDEITNVDVLLSRITFGILLCCSVLRIIYETFTLCFRMLSLLHLCENGLKLTQFLFEISLLLLSKPLLWLWYILSALLSEPLELLWNIIYNVFIQWPVAISKWIYRGPIAYLIDKLVVVVSIPLNILYQGISLILWLIGRPFIWLYILFESIFTQVAGLLFTFYKVVETVFHFIINIPMSLATLAYDYSYYIFFVLFLVAVYMTWYVIRMSNKQTHQFSKSKQWMESFSNSLSKLRTFRNESSDNSGKSYTLERNNQSECQVDTTLQSNNQAERPFDARDAHYFETTVHSAHDR